MAAPKFRPHQAVTHGEDCAQNPSQHGLRAAHGADDQRNGDERPDADHVDHVQRGGAAQADSADQGSASRWSLLVVGRDYRSLVDRVA